MKIAILLLVLCFAISPSTQQLTGEALALCNYVKNVCSLGATPFNALRIGCNVNGAKVCIKYNDVCPTLQAVNCADVALSTIEQYGQCKLYDSAC